MIHSSEANRSRNVYDVISIRVLQGCIDVNYSVTIQYICKVHYLLWQVQIIATNIIAENIERFNEIDDASVSIYRCMFKVEIKSLYMHLLRALIVYIGYRVCLFIYLPDAAFYPYLIPKLAAKMQLNTRPT